MRAGSYGGLVLVLLGLLFLAPLLAAGIARLLQPIVRIAFGLEARLAADNLVRAPGRTGLVITALAAGVAMVLQTAGVIGTRASERQKTSAYFRYLARAVDQIVQGQLNQVIIYVENAIVRERHWSNDDIRAGGCVHEHQEGARTAIAGSEVRILE